jgi:CheY-like chemotaxis protein/anti-sigma regulatory factor (Ser/Thr protein kinase)
VGHEINNPLAYLAGNLVFLRDDHGSRPWNEEELEAIDEALIGVERISEIVRGLMGISRGQVRRETASLKSVVDTAIKMARAPFDSSVQFVVEGDEWPDVQIEESKLVQVLLNLLINAAQASAGGEQASTIRVRCERRDQEVWLQVLDEGCGIAPEVLGRIFDPLYSTKDVGEGTGLGLFVSKGIVELSGGRLIAESEAGVGTTLSVVLMEAPAVSQGGKATAMTASSMSETLPKGLSLYIIDDEALVTRALVRMLRGTSVLTEKDSRLALEHLREGADYDVIICDLMMPGLSGVELYRRIQEQRPELATRFLFLTGGATTSDAEDLLQTPGVSFLYKPVEREELVDQIVRISKREG